MTELNIYVVDDDRAVLLSVQAVLSHRGHTVHCFASGEEFFVAAVLDRPGCVVTDVQMPGSSGVDLQRRLLAARSPLSVVVVTGVADVPTAVAMMENGAITLLEKPYAPADLLCAVERGLAASRERWRAHAVRHRLAQLTDEERGVLEQMLAGQPNKAIAHAVAMSMRTVDRRRQAVLEKMGVGSVPELALMLGAARLTGPTDSDSTLAARN